MNNPRREFVVKSTSILGSLVAFPWAAYAQAQADSLPADDPARPRQQLARVREFVQAAHSDLPRVKAMLEVDPRLVSASWDWGNGDWETALEGASHVAQRETVAFLLQKGARANLSSMAVLGHVEAVIAMLQAQPELGRTRGPHFLTLLYHAALGGRIELMEFIAPRLGPDRAQHCNQALRGAAQYGTPEMVAWLIDNGVTNMNETNFLNKTPLDVALARGDKAVATLLKNNGGIVSVP
jgi:hypothetical protein